MASKYSLFKNPLAKFSLQNCQEKVRATSLHWPGVVLTTAGKACLAIGIPTILLEDLFLSCFVQWFSRGEMLIQCTGPSAGGASSEAHGGQWHLKITDGDSYLWITAAADGHHVCGRARRQGAHPACPHGWGRPSGPCCLSGTSSILIVHFVPILAKQHTLSDFMSSLRL